MKLRALMLAARALFPFSGGGTGHARPDAQFPSFRKGSFRDLGGDASANIEIHVFPKTWSWKDSIGSATLLEPKGFLGSGVHPTK